MVRTASTKAGKTKTEDSFETRAERAKAEVEKDKLRKEALDALRGTDPLADLDEEPINAKPKRTERSEKDRLKHPYNLCSFVGNLGRDAEMNYTPTGKAVTKFSIAVWMGEDKPPMWMRCILWEEMAEEWGAILEKGDRVWVRGKLTFRQWESESGDRKTAYELAVKECELD